MHPVKPRQGDGVGVVACTCGGLPVHDGVGSVVTRQGVVLQLEGSLYVPGDTVYHANTLAI